MPAHCTYSQPQCNGEPFSMHTLPVPNPKALPMPNHLSDTHPCKRYCHLHSADVQYLKTRSLGAPGSDRKWPPPLSLEFCRKFIHVPLLSLKCNNDHHGAPTVRSKHYAIPSSDEVHQRSEQQQGVRRLKANRPSPKACSKRSKAYMLKVTSKSSHI